MFDSLVLQHDAQAVHVCHSGGLIASVFAVATLRVAFLQDLFKSDPIRLKPFFLFVVGKAPVVVLVFFVGVGVGLVVVEGLMFIVVMWVVLVVVVGLDVLCIVVGGVVPVGLVVVVLVFVVGVVFVVGCDCGCVLCVVVFCGLLVVGIWCWW